MITELVLSSSKVQGFTKSEISNLANEICLPVEEGFQSALQTDLQLKALEEAIKEARERINKAVRAEAEELISGGQKEVNKVSIEVRKGYASFDYSQDVEYVKIEEKLKARKTLLDQVAKSNGLVIIDEDSGEQIPKVPVKSYSKDSIVYKFSK